MENRSLFLSGILLLLAGLSRSRVIVPREIPSEDGEAPHEFGGDNKLGPFPGIRAPEEAGDDFGIYDFDAGVNDPRGPSDFDYDKPADGNVINEEDNAEVIPSHEGPDEKTDDEDFYEPFDGEEDKESKIPFEDADEPEEEDEKKVSEEEDIDERDKKEPEEDEGKKEPEDDDDKKESEDDNTEHVPSVDEEDESEEEHAGDDENTDEDKQGADEEDFGGEESKFFHGGSIFDTPIFNVEQVKKYFNQLERALGHVFQQTLDEALLLNGTYANTTEEEVDIDGKKYIVQKSVIKGADNDSSIYVEALSSKTKIDDTKGLKGIDGKNSTQE